MRPGTALLEVLTARLLSRKQALADEMVERIRFEILEFSDFDGPELWEAMRGSCLANIEAGLESMLPDRELPDSIPPDARDLARLTARLDLPLAPLLRAYRIGHAMIWERWFAAVEREPADPGVRRGVLDAASRHMFEYVDRLSSFVTDEYTAERDRFMRSREQRRTQLVRDILDGAAPDAAEALHELDYDLRLHHLACVITGPDHEAAVRDLGQVLDAAHQLVISLARDTAWAWLGRVREFAVPERLEAHEGAVASIGEPAPGTEGFRRSHREARDAHRVALRRAQGGEAPLPPLRGASPSATPITRPVVRYDDVALESLVVDDEARVRAFIARELRGLDGGDARSRRLRETLRAYFGCAQNASSAAALLGVHEHTVSYRLRAVEERLGRPVASRRAELETALRLLEMRGPAVDLRWDKRITFSSGGGTCSGP